MYLYAPILWMNVMLDFICISLAKLRGARRKRKIQNKNLCLQRGFNFALQPGALDHSATTDRSR